MTNAVKVIFALVSIGVAAAAWAQTPADDVKAAMEGELAANVLEGCESELTEYCSAVTPGERRILACLYAHEDKLSRQCGVALYDSAVRLERAINAIATVASSCRSELQSFCVGVEAGEGRITQCLKDHTDELTPACSEALSEVGVN
jgi:hypothetical protein